MRDLEPPPSMIGLVSGNMQADSTWKTWLNNLFQWNKGMGPRTGINMSTAERDALSATNGMFIYNTSTNVFNFYENGSWVTK